MIDVLIAGAGPTGLTAAITLARAGHRVRIVDAAQQPFHGSRGDGLQPRTLEVFDDLGVADRAIRDGLPPLPVRAYMDGEFVGEHAIFEPTEPAADKPYPCVWFVPQYHTEQILRDRLAEFGVPVEFGLPLTALDQTADRVIATVGGQTVSARYLVAADGGRSTVRKALGIGFAGETSEEIRMLLGDVRADQLDHGVGHWFARAEAPLSGVVLTPLAGSRFFQFGAPLPDDATEAGLAELQRSLDAVSGALRVRLDELRWSTVWRPNIRLAERFAQGRVFLAGDAVHVHPPTGGQGLNTGVQDGYNLGWKLAAVLSGADPVLLDSYERERLPVAAGVLELSTKILDKYTDGDEDAHQRGADTQQLGIGYRGGPLSVQEGAPLAGLRAGDRAPDADLGGRRMFDLLRGPQPTVLGFDVDVSALGGHRMSTADGVYGARPGAVVVVRPDGYLGYVGDSVDAAAAYLARIGGPVPVLS